MSSGLRHSTRLPGLRDLNNASTCTSQAASPTAPPNFLDRVNQCLADSRTPEGCDVDAAGNCFRPAFCNDCPAMIAHRRRSNQLRHHRAPSAGRAGCGGGGPQQVIVVSLGQRSNVSFEIVDRSFNLRRSISEAPVMMLRGNRADDEPDTSRLLGSQKTRAPSLSIQGLTTYTSIRSVAMVRGQVRFRLLSTGVDGRTTEASGWVAGRRPAAISDVQRVNLIP